MEYNVGYNLMWDTISMLSLTDPNMTSELIAEYLEEIEGDNYTFLHKTNIDEFTELGLIHDDIGNRIINLRQLVEALPTTLWNADAFCNSDEWNDIHMNAQYILDNLKSPH